tara:strand:- start:77332 stop:78108 length:777 start_codon:yes stop_codon:yes gene_type:complete
MNRMMWRLFGFLAVVCATNPAVAQHRTDVMVGVYEYSVVHFYHQGVQTGFAHELIKRLNGVQGDYQFVAVETSSRRRYLDIATGQVDMMILENPEWHWAGRNVEFSTPIVRESDIMVARRDHVPGPAYFSRVLERSIAGVLGFHYKFVDFRDDPKQLTRLLDISLLYNESEVMEAVIRGDAEIGILSAGFVSQQFEHVPDIASRIEIGPQADNSYQLSSVLSNRSPVSVERYNSYLDLLRAENAIAPNWSRWHRGILP